MLGKWMLDNPNDKHPMTSFFDNIGLSYMRLDKRGDYRCWIVDSKKYMITKIKYGI